MLIEENDLLYAIEIKSRQAVTTDMFQSLTWWRSLPNQFEGQETLIYGGGERFTKNGIFTRPC